MKLVGKALLYLLLAAAAVICFGRFREDFSRSDGGARRLERSELQREVASGGELGAGVEANEGSGVTNAPGTNGAAVTVESVGTNPVVTGVGATSGVVSKAGGAGTIPEKKELRTSRSGLYLGGFIGSLVGLAILLGWEISQWVGSRAVHGLGADLAPVEGDPDYDAAEAEWAKGNHLDAITMMRNFLKKNPSQQHAAIRIAEIYEKDLGNYLAAVLELEEVLGKRLPREKWGWTAVHLANLYSGRLNQPDKALGTLQRIVADYPETAAARKARQRLGLPEPVEEAAGEMAAENLPPAAAEEENPALPKGFRSRKK
jgi:TolA-binding protein